ncbi:prolipoprotein diacylglyceryl transferase [Candidatus Peregrinibacteria bacterium]|nr:prolipoprotein diacylglyceryl transferase [Candidatus Peregrinibacteria bacterium]
MLEILFQYGPVTVRTFNILLATGFLAGGFFLLKFVSRRKMSASFLAHFYPHFLLAALLGGRLAYIFSHLSSFASNPFSVLFIWDMGFSFFGCLYGLLIVLFFIARQAKEDFWAWLDAFMLTLLLILIFTHIGQFFGGIAYGKPTELPWGIAFDAHNIPFTTPLHPTTLYSALAALAVFHISLRYSKRTHLSGMAGSLALMLYSLASLGIDFFHGAPSLYAKISFGILAALAFVSFIHCSYKTHYLPPPLTNNQI